MFGRTPTTSSPRQNISYSAPRPFSLVRRSGRAYSISMCVPAGTFPVQANCPAKTGRYGFIVDADANRIARRPLRHTKSNASGNLGGSAQLGNLPTSANNPNARIFIIEMEQHFERIAARGHHVFVDVHKRMNVGGSDIGNRVLAAVSVGMATSVAANNPFAQFPVSVFSVIDLRLQWRSIPDLGRQNSRTHQTLGVIEKLRISRLIQPQRQLRDIAGRTSSRRSSHAPCYGSCSRTHGRRAECSPDKPPSLGRYTDADR